MSSFTIYDREVADINNNLYSIITEIEPKIMTNHSEAI